MYFLKNDFIFFIIESLFLLLLIFSILLDIKNKLGKKKLGIKVKRGSESFGYLTLAYSIASIFFIQIVNLIGLLKDYSLLILILNQILLIYLIYFNNWFRNKIIGFFIKVKDGEEH